MFTKAPSQEAGPHWTLVETGVVAVHQRPQQADVAARIKIIEGKLDALKKTWGPDEIACGKPSPMQLPIQQEGIEMLGQALEQWAREHDLPLYCYPHRGIRVAISGRANAAKDEMAYSVMTRWGLLGEGKTTHELNAIAVGDYHLGLPRMVAGKA